MLIDPYEWREAYISKLVRESPRAVSFCVEVIEPYDFLCGQYAVVRVAIGDIKLIRQYSFASAPNSNEIWFTVVEEPQGEVSGWLNHHMQIGDTIEISQPFTGSMHNLADTKKRICLMAGGSGIVPLMSHIRTWRSINATHDVRLLYSTHTNELCYQPELIAQENEIIIVRLTDTAARLSEIEIARYIQDSEIALICGSRHFIAAMRMIAEKYLKKENVISEAFSL